MPVRARSSVLALVAALAVLLPAAVPGAAPPAFAQEPTTPEATTPTTPAITPPSLVTGAAEAVAQTSAALTGSVAAGGAETTYFFELGTTVAYGVSTASQSVPAGTAPTAVRITATGLTAATVYHYRLVATNAAGTTRGPGRTFFTLAKPARPSVASVAATGVVADAAVLPAKISPRGQVTSYAFEWGTTKTFGTQTPAGQVGPEGTSVAVSAALTGLQPNTRYYYRAVATNPTGTTKGRTRTFLTPRSVSGVSMRAARSTVTWGAGTVVAGAVAGVGVGGVRVALMRQDFPYSVPAKEVAAMTTSDAGAFTFSVGSVKTATRLYVETRAVEPIRVSSSIAIKSRLLVQLGTTKRTSRSSTVRALIHPRVAKARATLQRRTKKGRWITVKRPKLSHSRGANRSSFTATIKRGRATERYRVVVDPRDDGAHVKTTSGSVTVSRRR